MPINKATGYLTSDGTMCATLEEAQVKELRVLLNVIDGSGAVNPEALDIIASDLVKHSDELLDILAMTPRSKPKARKQAGTTNPKRAARKQTPATPEQVQEGFAAMREAVAAA